MTALYDAIGRTYAQHRRVDERIAAPIWDAIRDSASVVNVGAGAGSYEPRDRHVVAVEPSATMIAQRAAGLAPAVQATAEALPFACGSFDAVMAVLTIHHWRDIRAGLRECVRVARRRIVLFTWDPASEGLWLLRDYFPALQARDRTRFPSIATIESVVGPLEVRAVPIPADCTDGFLGAYWRRPASYLDAGVRQGMSTFARSDIDLSPFAQLGSDLHSGEWARRYALLAKMESLDLGYRLLVRHLT